MGEKGIFMKLLSVKASRFKNCEDDFFIDFVAKSKKTSEDKEYELYEVTDNLYTFNTLAFIGKNASGKTTAVDLLDVCYSILSEFRLDKKPYNCDGAHLCMHFYMDGYIYRYTTTLKESSAFVRTVSFIDEKIERKKYFKTRVNEIYEDHDFQTIDYQGTLPEDTSSLFFVIGSKQTRAFYYDSFEKGITSYQLIFEVMKEYEIDTKTFEKIIRIFDENVNSIHKLDDRNYEVIIHNKKEVMSDLQLLYRLSSGTTKGLLLYVLVVASLKSGNCLIIDEIENHFHKTLVENIISLYKDKTVNKKGATLIFTTHYCEILDVFNRQDNIYICKLDKKVYLENMYEDHNIRNELLKSKQFYNNTFNTAVDYEALMDLKRELK